MQRRPVANEMVRLWVRALAALPASKRDLDEANKRLARILVKVRQPRHVANGLASTRDVPDRRP